MNTFEMKREEDKNIFIGKLNSMQFRAWFAGMRNKYEDGQIKCIVEKSMTEIKENISTNIKVEEDLKIDYEKKE